MNTLEVRPWRLVFLFGAVFLMAAYMPHPNLRESLPQSLNSLVKAWTGSHVES